MLSRPGQFYDGWPQMLPSSEQFYDGVPPNIAQPSNFFETSSGDGGMLTFTNSVTRTCVCVQLEANLQLEYQIC